MNAIPIDIELVSLFLLAFFSWMACRSAQHIRFSSTSAQLYKKASLLIVWNVMITLLAAFIVVHVAHMSLTMAPAYWMDRVFLHVPLIVMPIIMLWTHALSKLQMIRKTESRLASNRPPHRTAILTAAKPAFTVPYRLTVYGSLAAVYFCIRPPLLFSVKGTMMLLAFLTILIISTIIVHKAAYRRVVRTKHRNLKQESY